MPTPHHSIKRGAGKRKFEWGKTGERRLANLPTEFESAIGEFNELNF